MNKLVLWGFCCVAINLKGHEDPIEQVRRDRLARVQRVQEEELEWERAFRAGVVVPVRHGLRLAMIDEEDGEGIDLGFFSNSEDERGLEFVERSLPLAHRTLEGVPLPVDLSCTDFDIFHAILHNIARHYRQGMSAGLQERMAVESAWMEDVHELHRLCGRRALPHEDRYISWLVRGGRIEMDRRQDGYVGCLCSEGYLCTICAGGSEQIITGSEGGADASAEDDWAGID